MGPYQATIKWDDGVTQQATSLFGDFKGAHTFKQNNIFDITLTITDSNKASVTETFPIQVGDAQPDDGTGSMSGYFDTTCADGYSDGSSFFGNHRSRWHRHGIL